MLYATGRGLKATTRAGMYPFHLKYELGLHWVVVARVFQLGEYRLFQLRCQTRPAHGIAVSVGRSCICVACLLTGQSDHESSVVGDIPSAEIDESVAEETEVITSAVSFDFIVLVSLVDAGTTEVIFVG